jgi:hypothetical protein
MRNLPLLIVVENMTSLIVSKEIGIKLTILDAIKPNIL